MLCVVALELFSKEGCRNLTHNSHSVHLSPGMCSATILKTSPFHNTVVTCSLQMQVWDTAGQERFRTITQSYYRSAHAAMIAYDITRRATFDSVNHWIKEVEQYGAANVVTALIGDYKLVLHHIMQSFALTLNVYLKEAC